MSHRQNRRTTDPVVSGLIAGLKVRNRLTLSQWAEKKLVLPEEGSSSPGPYRVGDAAFQRGMMDAITDWWNDTICFVTSSQVGKTTALMAAQGYYAEHEPSPQLSIWPNNIVADKHYEERFKTTVRDSDDLAAIFDGTTYPGGYIDFVGANTPDKLAARPMRVITGDEVDRWPKSTGKEGTPRLVAERRLATYRGSRKAIYCSTPLDVKSSEIVAIFKSTLQHYYYLICPHCGHPQVLDWDQLDFTKGREEKAVYLCKGEDCGCHWTDVQKRALVRDAEDMGGGWIAPEEAPFKVFKQKEKPAPGRIGFWVNEMYSPWSSFEDMARGRSEAEGDNEAEKTFVNTRLGLPWDGDVSSVADAESLKQRREEYVPNVVPAMAGLVTAAVDVQDDRLEVLTVAWGGMDECWLLEHFRIDTDPSIKTTWQVLERELQRTYPHAKGRTLRIEAVAIDSGGHFTQQVYEFAGRHQKMGRLWHAIRGVPGEGKPIWKRSEERKKINCKLYLIGVDDAKTMLYTRYGRVSPGPGYVHIHKGVTDELIDQMTAEFCETEYKNGFPKRVWEKKPGKRNEMLDLMVYNTAVRSDLPIDINMRLRQLHGIADNPITPEAVGAMFR